MNCQGEVQLLRPELERALREQVGPTEEITPPASPGTLAASTTPSAPPAGVTSGRRRKCPHCDYSDTRSERMIQHIRVHTGEKPFACNLCYFRGADQNQLTRHLRSHTGSKPYACPHCDFSATQKAQLTRHLRTHSASKGFTCDHCDFVATRRETLTQHLKTHNASMPRRPSRPSSTEWTTSPDGEPMLSPTAFTTAHLPNALKCPHCGFTTSSKSALTRHVHVEHWPPSPSPTGEYHEPTEVYHNRTPSGAVRSAPRSSQPNPSIKCGHCGYTTTSRSALTRHVKVEHSWAHVQAEPQQQQPVATAPASAPPQLQPIQQQQQQQPGMQAMQPGMTLQQSWGNPYPSLQMAVSVAQLAYGHPPHGHTPSPLTSPPPSVSQQEFYMGHPTDLGSLPAAAAAAAAAATEERQPKAKSSRPAGGPSPTGRSGGSRPTSTDAMHHCPFCGYSAVTKSSLTRHVKVEHADAAAAAAAAPSPSESPQAPRSEAPAPTQQLRAPAGDKPYVCTQCDFTAPNKTQLAAHVRTHSEDKPYACEHCQYRAADSRALARHMRVHARVQMFSCDQCSYSGSSKIFLARHLRLHTGEKPFACEYCDYRTTAKAHLNLHLRQAHKHVTMPN